MYRMTAALMLGALLTFVASSCSKQPAGPGADGAKSEAGVAAPAGGLSAKPSAEEVIRRVAEFYQRPKSLQVDHVHTMHVQQSGDDRAMTSQSSVVAQRPNLLAMRQQKDGQGIDIVSDGKNLYIYVPAMKKYTQAKAASSFEEIARDPVVSGLAGGGPFLLNLLAPDPYQAIMSGVTSSTYVGRETIDGVTAHHLKFSQKDLDWELWVDAGAQPLVLRQAVDMTKALEAMGQVPKGVKLTSVQTYKNWKLDVQPSAEAFAFTAPEGAKKVDSLFEPEQREEEVSPLVGQPAPNLEAKRLDGASFQLKSEQGQRIVMLDFWATWCGPCVRELPILAEVAAEYREKGVAFYAVNLREDADTIREFLKKKELDVDVVLDSEGAGADSYGVRGIPFLVLIDKNGVVQSVHEGYSPQIKTILKQELDALLAGKNLAAEKAAQDKP